ncbi:DUF4145 domain-containing protein [Pantoea sp.]|uniref:DUF4145 domain-containing protein n=1 Tax=Pantoea sp. TaxID=69393 RepID=UPI0031E0161E
MSTWQCPYCGNLATSVAVNSNKEVHSFRADTKDGNLIIGTEVLVCPNEECKEYTFKAWINKAEEVHGNLYDYDTNLHTWMIKPQGVVKSFPSYVPKAILDDYREAALIKDLSPKASATLSRRCLQGMIRNFWQVNKANLFEEIKAIQDKVDSDTWEAIDAIRSIGNIGAHMEKDINLVIDVESDEAALLIQLIEILIKDWYVERENRRTRARAIVEAANLKKQQKHN